MRTKMTPETIKEIVTKSVNGIRGFILTNRINSSMIVVVILKY